MEVWRAKKERACFSLGNDLRRLRIPKLMHTPSSFVPAILQKGFTPSKMGQKSLIFYCHALFEFILHLIKGFYCQKYNIFIGFIWIINISTIIKARDDKPKINAIFCCVEMHQVISCSCVEKYTISHLIAEHTIHYHDYRWVEFWSEQRKFLDMLNHSHQLGNMLLKRLHFYKQPPGFCCPILHFPDIFSTILGFGMVISNGFHISNLPWICIAI